MEDEKRGCGTMAVVIILSVIIAMASIYLFDLFGIMEALFK